MRRRILVAILSVVSVAVVLFGVPLAIVVERFDEQNDTLRLERRAILAARDVPSDFATSHDPVEFADDNDGVALGLYSREGVLVAGTGPSRADSTTMRALQNEVVNAEETDAFVVAVPVAADELVVGVIRAQQSTASSEARSRRIVALVGALAIGVLAVGAGIGYVVAGRLARPVRRLRDAAVQLGEGDFTIEVSTSGVPELDQAGQAMMVTARRLDDLVGRERAFSADASHQLRTPLAGLRAAIETELAFPREDRTEVLREAIEDIDRLEQIIAELLAITRTPNVTDTRLSIADVLAEIDVTWRGKLAARGRPLTIADADDAPPVRGDGPVLRHALDVLVDNALTHGAGEVRIDHSYTGDTVTLSVTDEGPQVSEQSAPGPATPRGDTEQPHGLGLPLARRLVESMPGRLTIHRSDRQWRVDIALRRALAPGPAGPDDTAGA